MEDCEEKISILVIDDMIDELLGQACSEVGFEDWLSAAKNEKMHYGMFLKLHTRLTKVILSFLSSPLGLQIHQPLSEGG